MLEVVGDAWIYKKIKHKGGILNMAQMNLSTKQIHRQGEQTCGCQKGGRLGREGLGVWD